MLLTIAISYYLIVNIIGFYLMKIDKAKARKNQYRISERTLWLFAVFYGAAGMTIGMKRFRHKTKHVNFKYGLPLLAIIELALIPYIINKLS